MTNDSVKQLSTVNDEQFIKLKIRNLVAGVYDIQKLRIATGNRIVSSFNIQMGQEPSTPQSDMDAATVKMIEQLRAEYKLITDAYVNKKYTEVIISGESSDKRKNKYSKTVTDGETEINKDTKKSGTKQVITKEIKIEPNAGIEKIIKSMSINGGVHEIKTKLDYDLIGTYVDLIDTEEKTLKILSKEVEKHPMWDMFFKDVKGCGPLMAAVCIAYFDIDKARHVSSFWKYAGLDTVDVVRTVTDDEGNESQIIVNEGRAAKHAKFTVCTYTDKDGNTQTKTGLGYNPILKSKLIGVLGSCILKANLRTVKDADGKPILDENGNKQQVADGYAKIYVDYMHRLRNRTDAADITDSHKHNMAVRYMVKMFLRDLWTVWREYAGYEVTEPYEVAKLGMKPHKYNEAQVKAAERTRKDM